MQLLDLNSIQKFEEVTDDDGKKFNKRVYDPEKEPVIFEVKVPGDAAADKKNLIEWMESFEHPDYVIVYDHRFKSVHVEYKYKVLKDLEEAEAEEEPVVDEEFESEAEESDEEFEYEDEEE